ncbi:MAG: hypothetical protein AAF581_00625 [Planctomycetota bacterium]
MPIRLACAATLLAVGGCFAPLKDVRARSALEQQVTSSAITAAVAKLDLEQLERSLQYSLAVRAPEHSDRESVRGALESHLLDSGFEVRRNSDSTVLLEATVDYAGSDAESFLLGLPLVVPGLTWSIDISIYKSTTITGRAQLGLSVWDSEGRLVRRIPSAQATRFFQNYTWFSAFGAFIDTDVEGFRVPGQNHDFGEEPPETGQ